MRQTCISNLRGSVEPHWKTILNAWMKFFKKGQLKRVKLHPPFLSERNERAD
jgi:hypothetical protein